MELLSNRQPLARRLLGQYLMFGLASIIALTVTWLAFSRSSLNDDELAIRVDEVRSLVVADQVQNGGAGVKSLIHLLGNEEWVAYAGIIAPDGRFVSHSNPSRIGHTSDHHMTHLGEKALLERHIMSHDGKRSREYWAPLVAGNKNFGTLRVGLVDEVSVSWLKRVTAWLPFAILTPVVILGAGAVCLRGAARTNAAIEDQLCAVSEGDSIDKVPLRPLDGGAPAALGWNRLIEQAHKPRAGLTLETKLSQSLGGLQEKRFERMLNSLFDGIAVTDKDGRITYANRPFCALLRLTVDAAALRGKPIQELFPPQADLQMGSEQESRPAIFEVQQGSMPADGVLRISRSPLTGEGNTVAQQIWTIRDVTQQKLADEMRNQFVYSATHELRTPLANIKAYAETLAFNDIADPEMQKGFLNTINSEATRLARFVEDLLDVSQMEAGSLSLIRSEVDTARLLTEVAEKVRPQMVQKNISFDVLMPPKLPKVHVDKDKFVGAVINLLGNAAKYTPDNGRVTFKVTAGPKELQISVEDTGIGIAADEIAKLFTKFFRSADNRVRDIPGSGLGLSFAQEVARLHGGKLLVHSELNKGSQFTMTLPVE